jgi:hypothetical protein
VHILIRAIRGLAGACRGGVTTVGPVFPAILEDRGGERTTPAATGHPAVGIPLRLKRVTRGILLLAGLWLSSAPDAAALSRYPPMDDLIAVPPCLAVPFSPPFPQPVDTVLVLIDTPAGPPLAICRNDPMGERDPFGRATWDEILDVVRSRYTADSAQYKWLSQIVEGRYSPYVQVIEAEERRIGVRARHTT